MPNLRVLVPLPVVDCHLVAMTDDRSGADRPGQHVLDALGAEPLLFRELLDAESHPPGPAVSLDVGKQFNPGEPYAVV